MGIYGDFMGLYWMEIFKVENLQVTMKPWGHHAKPTDGILMRLSHRKPYWVNCNNSVT
jgi:hypothetical protein